MIFKRLSTPMAFSFRVLSLARFLLLFLTSLVCGFFYSVSWVDAFWHQAFEDPDIPGSNTSRFLPLIHSWEKSLERAFR